MNDRYLFKAKRVDNGEWVIGCLLVFNDGEHRIVTSCLESESEILTVCAYPVDPSTICQYKESKEQYKNAVNDLKECLHKTYIYKMCIRILTCLVGKIK